MDGLFPHTWVFCLACFLVFRSSLNATNRMPDRRNILWRPIKRHTVRTFSRSCGFFLGFRHTCGLPVPFLPHRFSTRFHRRLQAETLRASTRRHLFGCLLGPPPNASRPPKKHNGKMDLMKGITPTTVLDSSG